MSDYLVVLPEYFVESASTELPLQLSGAQVNHSRPTVGAGVGDGSLLELTDKLAHFVVA